MTALTVAVDGSAGSGKSSVSRGVAAELGMRYLDTGAMYRAATLWMLRAGIDVEDAAAVAGRAGDPVIESTTDPAAPAIALDGQDVSTEIRTPDVTGAVSAVSAVPQVRTRMVQMQREAVAVSIASGEGIIVEGRDIGTVVLPEADLKVFLVADPQVRAQRRAAEDAARGHGVEVAATAQDLARRDAADSQRKASPLAKADDAVVVDATYDDLATVIGRVKALVVDAGR
ncbi:MAG: CMP/dCMP kinase [Actinomycetota bacterium]|nr:CMP/dCMP kinase [Actinomycetota bacterium]